MIRIELECEAVRQATPFTKVEIAHLDDLLVRSRDRCKHGDNAAIVVLNREFHFSIYEKAESPRRLKLISQLWLHSARYQRLSLNYRHDGDHEGAATALKSHLETIVRLMNRQIDDSESNATSSLLVENVVVIG